MLEYMPRVWDALEETFGVALTASERGLIEILRSVDPTRSIALDEALVADVRGALKARLPGT